MSPIRVRALTPTVYQLSWTAPSDSNGVAFYDVRYATFPLTEAKWDSAIPVTDLLLPAPAVYAGDLVTFQKGMHCVWDISAPIRKHYRFD